MKNKSVFIISIIRNIIILLMLIFFFLSNWGVRKLMIIPFIICVFSSIGKNICFLVNDKKLADIFNKLFIISFLCFWFGFLMFWCYLVIRDKNVFLSLFTIPFWMIGISLIKKYFFKSKNSSINTAVRKKVNFKIIVTSFLVFGTFLMGIVLLVVGIVDTYKLSNKTKGYLTTNGYYNDYSIYSNDKDKTLYRLTYVYNVDNKEYLITTDYGTNFLPEKNSIRQVKFDPDNPESSVLLGANSKKSFIFFGAFFTLVSFTFILFALTVYGYFDRFKVDIIGIYISLVLLLVGSGIILFQNDTTGSFVGTIKSFGL